MTSLRVGRSLKEMKVPPSGMAPLGSQTPTLPMLQKRAVLSADANLSTDGLKRRIRDLELENQKLKSHVDQAEKSIHNYRGFLHKPQGQSKSISCQTDPVRSYDVRNPSSILNNTSGKDPEKELQSAKRERDNLRASVENLSALLREKTLELESRDGADAEAREAAFASPAVMSTSMSTSMTLDNVTVPRAHLLELHLKVIQYRAAMKGMQRSVAQELGDFKLALEAGFSAKIAACLQQLSSANQIQQLVLKKTSQSSVPSTPVSGGAVRAGSPASRGPKPLTEALSPVLFRGGVSKEATPLVQHSTPLMKLGPISSPPVLVSQSTSAAKFPSLHSTPLAPAREYAATSCQTSPMPARAPASPAEEMLSAKDAQLLQQHLQEQQQHLQQQLAAQTARYDLVVREHEVAIRGFHDDLSALRERNRNLAAQLTRAHEYFTGNTLAKVKQEVAAIKQSAHVKDLVKVAAARELTLEKDSLMNEMAFKK
jgi:hypothetical protein